jgi:hypothetical protein
MHRQGEQEQKLSLASQAYKLFSEGKTLAQVASYKCQTFMRILSIFIYKTFPLIFYSYKFISKFEMTL